MVRMAQLTPIVRINVLVPELPEVLLPAGRRDILHLLRRQLKAGQLLQIPLQPLLITARRERHNALVQTPPQRHLGFADSVLLGQLRVNRIHGSALSLGDGRQRRVGLNGNVLLPAVGDQIIPALHYVLQVRVVLDLVHHGRVLHATGDLENRLQVLNHKVRHANRLGHPAVFDLLHLAPRLVKLLGSLCEKWGVKQVQVDVIEPQLFQGTVECFSDGVPTAHDSLGRDEELVPRQLGLRDGAPQLGLVTIGLGAVQVRVAGLDGREGGG